MAPVANADASTSRIKGLFGSGLKRTGSLSTIMISLFTALVCVFDHVKVVPFFRRFASSRAMCVNPGMKGHW